MRDALEKKLVPELKGFGFVGADNDFQRKRGATLDLLSIRWGLHGGEFILEFGKCPSGFSMDTPWGDVISEERITVAHLDHTDRARLEPTEPSKGKQLQGFFFGGSGGSLVDYENLACSVSALFSQVCIWLESGSVGPNVHPLMEGAVAPMAVEKSRRLR